MRYFSLLAAAATLMIACGCDSRSTGSSGANLPPVCASCGVRHYSNHMDAAEAVGTQSGNLRLVSVSGAEVANYAGDYGPAQVFEVQGSDNAAIKLGRVWPSCNCIQVVSGPGSYPAGTPARIVLRQVSAPPAGGVEIYVQVQAPQRTLLSAPIPVKQ